MTARDRMESLQDYSRQPRRAVPYWLRSAVSEVNGLGAPLMYARRSRTPRALSIRLFLSLLSLVLLPHLLHTTMPASNASATVVADNDDPSTSRSPSNGKGKAEHHSDDLVPPPSSVKFLTQTIDPLSVAANRQFFVPINEANGGLVVALQALHEKLLAAGKNGLISKKQPFTWTGRKIEPGFAGFYDVSSVLH